MDQRRGSTGSYSASFDPRTVALLNRIASKRKALLGRSDLVSNNAIKSRDGQGVIVEPQTHQVTVNTSSKAGGTRPVSTVRTNKLTSMINLGESIGLNQRPRVEAFKEGSSGSGISDRASDRNGRPAGAPVQALKRIGSAPPPNQRGMGEPTPPGGRSGAANTVNLPGGRPGSATLKSWSHRGERAGSGGLVQGLSSGQGISPLKADAVKSDRSPISIHGRNPGGAGTGTLAGDAGAALAQRGNAEDRSRGNTTRKPSASGKEDNVVFAESAYAPGVPVVYRTNHERATNPERLNLDRRKLSVCPILEGEERLRLLNYQNNSIQEITNIKRLPNLIFLDLYNNNITEIKNLENVPTLRVLMLGKNQIEVIKGLDSLLKLDVLDLHSNRISTIENIGHLSELRVLNLAGNQIVTADGFEGLAALTELNLRRNKVVILNGLDGLPSLQRVFLSNNQIAAFDACSCLFRIKYLMELALDGNPVAGQQHYRQQILENIRTLRHLDLKRITEEERRISAAMQKKEEERIVEKSRRELINEERTDALQALQRDWRGGGESSRKGWFEVEKKGDIELLHIFGNTMDCIDKCPLADGITFNYVSFDRILAFLPKLRKMANLKQVRFSYNNLDSFAKICRLHTLSNVVDITIENNDIIRSNLLRKFVVYRLSHVEMFNGEAVTGHERVAATMYYSSLNKAMARVPHAWIDPQSLPRPSSDVNAEGENEVYQTYVASRQSVNRNGQKSVDVANRFVNNLTAQSIGVVEKIDWLDKMWAGAVSSIVRSTVHDLEDMSSFMTHCLDDM